MSQHDLRLGKRGGTDKRDWLTELVSRAAELRRAAEPRPYWPQRQGRGLSRDGSTVRDTRRDFERVISDSTDNGHLVEVFDELCVDACRCPSTDCRGLRRR
ncbi:hypothetical protein EV284_0733 [Streptomyces sp. BK022]|nr:hypothetical protein [Streptomyces sp. BK022]RZU46078.1 hypothetical protein EV284_0733 [Streptomyces sp. BK022]